MRVVVTGADGFIGKNLRAVLMERNDVTVLPITRSSSTEEFANAVAAADTVVHLAGANRPRTTAEFSQGNAELTLSVCNSIRKCGRQVPLILTSSIQAEGDSLYGASKRTAENHVLALNADTGNPVAVYRLPNVFGKWALPNYNSAVATFCHNTVHDLPLTIHDPAAEVRLVYIDDVVADFVRCLDGNWPQSGRAEVTPVYVATVGRLVETIQAFRASRLSLMIEPVGIGLTRALYATYVSYLAPEQFTYSVPKFEDPRGVFVEVLKTPNCGQFSFFTALPGVTRGGHYHHSKTEKFLVVKGQARFNFSHIVTGQTHELHASGEQPVIVETVPGWAHEITNVGDSEMLVMLWANEVFDRARPDTYAHNVRA